MPQTQTQTLHLSDDEKQAAIFIETLVRAILGYSILEIPEEKRLEAIKQCVNLFSDYIIRFVAAKYGKKDSIRIQASQMFAGQDIFHKFQELGPKFDEASLAFFEAI